MFCSHILLCNILTTILKPNFEEPLDTAKQLVEKHITLYFGPQSLHIRDHFRKSVRPEYRILGKNGFLADSWDHFDNLSRYDVFKGTHAQVGTMLAKYELKMGKWHKSKETVTGTNPYGGFLSNKKWHLNEVNHKHLLLALQFWLDVDNCYTLCFRNWQNICFIFSK